MSNPLKGVGVEFHILQSFPVTCLNRDDVGAPKSAIVGGVPRARVSSQCWKRQVRLALHDMGVRLGMRTKRVAELLQKACLDKGAPEDKAAACAAAIAAVLTKDTLLFISAGEIDRLAAYAAERDFALPVEVKGRKSGKGEEDGEAASRGGALPKSELGRIKKCLSAPNRAADGLDIALFGRMVAQEPSVNVHAAASFSHAISTHQSVNEVEFFTALDDMQSEPGSAHMGSLEYNSATYYRYVSLDLGQLWENLGGDDVDKAVEYFIKALYTAVPAARQATQAGACLWDYARVLVRKGQRMQLSCDAPVRSTGAGWLVPSIEALDAALDRNESLCGSLYGKAADVTFGKDAAFSIDALCAEVLAAVADLERGA